MSRPQVLSNQIPDYRVTADPGAWDNLIQNYGIPLIHYRAMRCPVGLIDPNDVRRGHEHHAHCSNGFLYKPMGKLIAVATSNQTDPRLMDLGFLNGSAMQVTFSQHYETNDKEVYVLPFDRFFLDDPSILVATWELVRTHESGTDKTKFPVAKVENVIDSANVEYDATCFDIVEGNIRWRTGQGPTPGTVYVVWYQYQPYWIVKMLVHEIRVSPVRDYMDGSKINLKRAPFAAVLQRENFFRNEEVDEQTAGPRSQPEAPSGGFGAR